MTFLCVPHLWMFCSNTSWNLYVEDSFWKTEWSSPTCNRPHPVLRGDPCHAVGRLMSWRLFLCCQWCPSHHIIDMLTSIVDNDILKPIRLLAPKLTQYGWTAPNGVLQIVLKDHFILITSKFQCCNHNIGKHPKLYPYLKVFSQFL